MAQAPCVLDGSPLDDLLELADIADELDEGPVASALRALNSKGALGARVRSAARCTLRP